jgi:hypothetical protein
VDPRRLADSAVAASGRSLAARPEAQPAAAHQPLEDFRQPPRSLVAPTLLALLIAGWTALPGSPLSVDGCRGDGLASNCCQCSRVCWTGPPAHSQSPCSCETSERCGHRPRAGGARRRSARVSRVRFGARDWPDIVRLAVTKRRLLEWETASTSAAKGAASAGREALAGFPAR